MDSVLSLFYQAAAKNFNQPAVILKEQILTYKHLEELSNRAAAHLIKRGLGPGKVAAILLQQSIYAPALILAVLKTGAAYLPLDANYPPERLNFMLRDSQSEWLLYENGSLMVSINYSGTSLNIQDLIEQPSEDIAAQPLDRPGESLAIVLYTSGSTGVPKGIQIPWRALNCYINNYLQLTGIQVTSRVTSYASFSFDAHVLEIYPPLCSGATLYIIPQEIRLNFPKLSQFIEENKISHAFMTTQAAFQFVSRFDSQFLHLLITGGEKLPSFKPDKRYRLLNLYGPTETLCSVSGFIVDKYYENIPIGYPHPGSRFYILDEQRRLLPAGQWGELYIASPQIMLGYIGRKDEESQALRPNPFYDPQHDAPYYQYLYRSGDKAMLTSEGCCFIGGRLDRQVKVRGFRVELGEIEECLGKYPNVTSVAAKAWPSVQGLILTAYFTAEGPIDEQQLLAYFAQRKPSYMTPQLVRLANMPLSVNSKIDYASLPPLDLASQDSEPAATKATAAETPAQPEDSPNLTVNRCGETAPTKTQLKHIVSAIIKQEHFSERDDLWDLGLNSLGLISLISEIYQTTGLSLEVTDVYKYRNVKALAQHLHTLTSLEKEGIYNGAQADHGASYPLSAVQRGVYLDAVRWSNKCIYNNPILIKFAKRDTSLTDLHAALEQVIAAYPALKTYLRESLNDEGDLEARLHTDEPQPFRIVVKEIKHSEPVAGQDYFIEPFHFLRGKEAFTPEAYLGRFYLLHNQKNIFLFFDIHHIITDGQSLTLLLNSLAQAYGGQELKIDYYQAFQYNLQERTKLEDRQAFKEQAQAHFKRLLGAQTQDMTLPGAKAAFGARLQGHSLNLQTDKITSSLLTTTCQKLQVTPNALCCAVFGLVLACFKGQEEAVFNSICNGRPRADLNSTLGMFTRTYPIKVNIAANLSVNDFAQKIQKEIADNLGYANYSYAELLADFDLRNLPSLIYQGDFLESFTFNGKLLPVQQIEHEESGVLAVEVYTNNQGMRLRVSWQEPLYTQVIAKNLAQTYLTALLSFMEAKTLSQVQLLSSAAQKQLRTFNDTDEPYTYIPTIKRFEEAVDKYSNHTAVANTECCLTYTQLNNQANALAHFIKQKIKCLRDVPVAVITDRSPYAYIARLAIMKAGGAFMCLDPTWPAARLTAILKESETPLVLVAIKNDSQLANLCQNITSATLNVEIVELEKFAWAEYPNNNLDDIEHRAEDLAYIIYTSGSTGTPKGVMIEEHSLSHLVAPLKGNAQYWAFVEDHKTCVAWCSLAFDVSVLEFIASLCAGLSVWLASEEEIHNPNLLGQSMLRHQVDVIASVPSYMLNSLESDNLRQAVKQLKTIILGGEHFSTYLYDQLKQINPQLKIFNCYGPSETTVACSAHQIEQKGETSLGRATANTKLLMLNRFNQVLPWGAVGELTILGEGVGRGYLANPQQTAQAFINLDSHRAYKSGDLAWWDYNGQIQILGRLDNQVKRNGMRVELDEIKSRLLSYPAINSAAVTLQDLNEQNQLCAYFTSDQIINLEDLRAYLRQKLPYYMVPDALIKLEKLPLTANGKLDAKSLPKPTLTYKHYVAPRTKVESDFCAIFQEVLQLHDNVSVDDSFFDLGGASLRVTKVVLAAERRGYSITYGEVFNCPTPAALANLVQQKNSRTLKVIATPEDIAAYDYTAINNLLVQNTLQGWNPKQKQDPGNIMLTGATGFLGIHILRSFLENYSGHCCCLMRKGKQKNLKSRLQGLLVYYFSSDFEEYFLNGRLTLIEGDITDKQTFSKLKNLSIDTLFNCSANVRHFEADDLLDKVNVEGTNNIASYCLEKNIKLIHISTSSVAGLSLDGTPNPFEPMTEHMFYFGQQMDNKYMLSKFRAERLVFEYILKGLNGKIMRVGNLMARNQDGEFQINVKANSFANKLRAYHTIGCISYEDSGVSVELSPIDFTAEAILLLSQTPKCCCLFHPFSNRAIYMYDLVKVMRRQGLIINQCLQEQFIKTFQNALQDPNKTENFSSLIAYRSLAEGHTINELKADNAYTMQALYRFQFNWPLVSEAYLNKFINSLDSLGFFDDFL